MGRFVVHGIVMLVLTAFALTTNSLPPLVTTIAGGFKIPVSAFGPLFALQYAMFALAAFLSSFAQKRVRIRNRTFVVVGLVTLSGVLLSAPLFRSRGSLYLLIVLLGVAGGLVESHGSVVVAELDERKSSQYLNLSQAFFCLGGIAAPFTIGHLFRMGLSWQRMLVIFGAFIAFVAVVFAMARPVGERVKKADEGSAARGTVPTDLPASRSRTAFLLLSALMFFYTAGESTIVSWLPGLFEIARSVPKDEAAGFLGLFWSGVLVARFAMFFYPSTKGVAGMVGISLVLSILGIGLLWIGVGVTASRLLVVIIGLAFGPIWPGVVAISREDRGAAGMAVRIIGIGGLGAAVGPLASAELIRTAGIESIQPLLVAMISMQLLTFALYLRIAARSRSA